MDANTTFHTYINTHVFIHNMTPLDVIRQYLLDNNIPNNYKNINAVNDTIHMIEANCNNQLNMINMNNYNPQNNANNNLHAELQNRLNIIIDLRNILNNIINNNMNY
jgi:hypothetical protein